MNNHKRGGGIEEPEFEITKSYGQKIYPATVTAVPSFEPQPPPSILSFLCRRAGVATATPPLPSCRHGQSRRREAMSPLRQKIGPDMLLEAFRGVTRRRTAMVRGGRFAPLRCPPCLPSTKRNRGASTPHGGDGSAAPPCPLPSQRQAHHGCSSHTTSSPLPVVAAAGCSSAGHPRRRGTLPCPPAVVTRFPSPLFPSPSLSIFPSF